MYSSALYIVIRLFNYVKYRLIIKVISKNSKNRHSGNPDESRERPGFVVLY